MALTPHHMTQGPLILVSKAAPYRDSNVHNLVPVDGDETCLMDRTAYHLLDSALNAAKVINDIVFVSGWRSKETQATLYETSLRKRGAYYTECYVALPGCSEHETGYAIDIGKREAIIDLIAPRLPQDGMYGHFRKIAHKHGFIQRYHASKQHLTGIAEEPWHFRYVGAPHAQIMVESDWCLEEYLSYLKTVRTHEYTLEGRRIIVRYFECPLKLEWVEVESGTSQISGDNNGGIIVTTWCN